MIEWRPDSCDCIIKCERPSIAGTFENRCEFHKRSNSTLNVYQHNILFKEEIDKPVREIEKENSRDPSKRPSRP